MQSNSIGALWKRTSKKGTKYISGVIEINGVKYSIVAFVNSNKQKDKHPDFQIYLQDNNYQGGGQAESKSTFKDDIPF